MSTAPAVEEQISLAGLTYGRRHAISYRAGLVIQVFGLAILAVLYPLESPFYTLGIMVFELGALLSAVYLFVWTQKVKAFILGSVFIGLIMQVAGYFVAPEQYAGSVLIAGIGLVCVGASGMAAKEAYCFGFREGWLLAMAGFPVMVLINLAGKENHIVNSLGFSLLLLLFLSLVGKKLRQPLLSQCMTDVCGTPEKTEK